MDKNSDDHDLSTNTLVPINDPNDHIEENNYTIEHTSDGPTVINMPVLSCDLDEPKKQSTITTTFPASVADIPLPGETLDEIPLPPVTTQTDNVANNIKVDSTVPMDTSQTINDSTVLLNESNSSNTSCNLQLLVSSEDQDVSMESEQSVEGLHITGDDIAAQEMATVPDPVPNKVPEPVPTKVPVPTVPAVVEQPQVEQQPVIETVVVHQTSVAQETIVSTVVLPVTEHVPEITMLKMEDDEVEEIVGDYSTAPLAVKKGTVRKCVAKEQNTVFVKQTAPTVATAPKPLPSTNTNQKALNDITAEAVMDEEDIPEPEDDPNTILPHNTKHNVNVNPQPTLPTQAQQPQPKKQAAIVQQQVVVAAAGEDGKPVYYLETVDEDGVVVMQEAALLVEGDDDEEEEDEVEEGDVRLVHIQGEEEEEEEEEEEGDDEADYQEAENIQLYITSDDISEELDSQSGVESKASRDIIPSHLQGRTVNAPSRDSVKNGKSAPKPRLGVKVPYKNLTSQIVSKAEITEAIMERSMRTSALSKKMTKRLATKIIPDDGDDADDPEHEMQPLAKKKAYITAKGVTLASGRRVVGGSGTEDLLAILEGNEDEKGQHHAISALIPTTIPISNQRIQQQLTAAEERAIALKQLQAIDSDSDEDVEDIRNIQETLKRHQAATGQMQSSRRSTARENRDFREASEAAATLQRQNRTNSQSSNTSSDGKVGSHVSSATNIISSKVVVQSVEPGESGTPIKRPRGRPKKIMPQIVVVEEFHEETTIETIENNSTKEKASTSEPSGNQAQSSNTSEQSQSASASKNAETPAESPRTTSTRVNSEPEPKFASHVPLKTYARKRKQSETGIVPTGAKEEYDFVKEEANSDKAGEETTSAFDNKVIEKKLIVTINKLDDGKKDEIKDKEKESSNRNTSSTNDIVQTPLKDFKISNSDNKEDAPPTKVINDVKKEEAPNFLKNIEDHCQSLNIAEETAKSVNRIQEDSTILKEHSKTHSKKPVEDILKKTVQKESISKSSSAKKIEDAPLKTLSNKKEDISTSKDKKQDSIPKSSTKDKEKIVEKAPTIPPTMHMTKSARVIKKKVIWDPDDAGSPLKLSVKSFCSSASTSSTISSTGLIGEREKSPAKVERKIKSTENKQKVEEKVQSSIKKNEIVVETKKTEERKTPVVEIKAEVSEDSDTSPAISPAKKRKLHEVAKLLKDEGAINMLYSLKSNQNEDAEAGNMRSSRKNKDFLGKASDLYEDLTTISSMESPKALRKKAGPIIHEKKKRSLAAPMMARKKSGDSYRSSNHSAPASPQYAGNAASFGADASRIIRRRSSSSFGSLEDGQAQDGTEEEELTEEGDTEGSVIDVDNDESLKNDTLKSNTEATPLPKQADKDKPSTTPIVNNNRRKQLLTTSINNPSSPKRQKTTLQSIEQRNPNDSDRTNITAEIQQAFNEPAKDEHKHVEEVLDKKETNQDLIEEEEVVEEQTEEEENEEDEEIIDLTARLKDWEGETVMENEFVRMTQREQVWRITLLEGEKYNGKLNFEILKQLTILLTELETNEKCHVVMFTSTTPSFCTGLSFITLFNQNEQIALRNSTELAFIIRKFLIALAKFPKPLIAGIRGGANCGLGCTMLPLFDVVISADTATFSACPDALSKRFNLVEGGSLLTGANLVQHTLVSELLFVGGKLTAAQALRYGLVTRLVWPSNYDADLHRTVCNIASHSLEFLKSTKKQTRHHTIATIVEQIKAETDTLIKHWTSHDCQQQFQKLQQDAQTQS